MFLFQELLWCTNGEDSKKNNQNMQSEKVIVFLQNNNIEIVDHIHHAALFTVDDVKKEDLVFNAAGMKTLFLRDHKKKNYFLVALHEDKMLDLQKLAEIFMVKKLSFVSESELFDFLSVRPGSVSPFALINYQQQDSETFSFFVDKYLLEAEQVAAHPNINTATLILDKNNFLKYLENIEIGWKEITL